MWMPSFMQVSFQQQGIRCARGARGLVLAAGRTASRKGLRRPQTMRNRPREPASRVESLRMAIDCMPVASREAMLRGLRDNERIIVGAYVDELGGVCPMLVA